MITETLTLNIDAVPLDEQNLYRNGLEQALEFYSIEDSAVSQPKSQVIEGAIRLLSEYEIDPVFLEDPEKCLFALAIADSWTENTSLEDKKAYTQILKLMAVGFREDGKDYASLSDKVLRLSNSGRDRGKEFDPTHKSEQDKNFVKVNHLLRTCTDISTSLDLKESFKDTYEGGLLNKIRKKFGISLSTEVPFEVIVLKISGRDLFNNIGADAVCFQASNGTNIMVLGNDYNTLDPNFYDDSIVQHEYLHTQSGGGLKAGYKGLIFRGINEGITEKYVDNPSTYPEQRKVLDNILAKNPELEDLFIHAYMQRDPNRQRIYTSLISTFGLVRFLKLSRLSAISDNMEGPNQSKIFIAPGKILTDLGLEEKIDPELAAFLAG